MSELLPAWQRALLQMRPGDMWRLYQHPDLAYGMAGFQRAIKPGGASVCELELLEVLPPDEPAGAGEQALKSDL